MFKSILRLSNIKRTITLNNFVKGCSTNSLFGLDQNEVKKRIDLREQYIKSKESNESNRFNESNEFNELKVSNRSNDDLLDPKESFSSYSELPVINSIQETASKQNVIKRDEQFEQFSSRFERSTRDNQESVHNKSNDIKFDDLIFKVKNSYNLLNLFEIVQPNTTQLNSNQIRAIFDKINDLYYLSRSNEVNFIHFLKTIEQSMIFKLLLNQVNYSLINLDGSCLVTLLHTFNLLNEIEHPELIKNTVRMLRSNLDSLDLIEINKALFVLSFHPEQSSSNDNLSKLNQELVEKAKLKILNNEFNTKDINTITRLFHIFLKPETDRDHEVINHLTELLLQPTTILNVKQSIKILRRIKKSHVDFRRQRANSDYIIDRELELRYRRAELFPKILDKLIDKCNQSIYESFYLDPTEENLHFFFVNLHDSVDTINFEFKNFYDEKLLNFLIPYVMRVFETKNIFKLYTYNLISNYAQFDTYNEELLKLVYDYYLFSEIFRSKIEFSQFYALYTRFRFPFTDHKQFAKFVASPNSMVKLERSIYFKLNSVKCLTRAILNDVDDERFLTRTVNAVQKLNPKLYRQLLFKLYKEVTLSNVLLQIYSDLEPNLKSKIIQTLNNTINLVGEAFWRPQINYVFIKINDKLQRNGFLSNEIFLDSFGIYDRSIQDFISLAGYESYFDSAVDKIPLTKDQELFTFIETSAVKGNIHEYETPYNYKLKQVLDHFKIKSIKVYYQDFKILPLEEQVEFLLKKASEHYKS